MARNQKEKVEVVFFFSSVWVMDPLARSRLAPAHSLAAVSARPPSPFPPAASMRRTASPTKPPPLLPSLEGVVIEDGLVKVRERGAGGRG